MSGTTSSSSAAAPAAARWSHGSRPRARRSCCSSAATGCRASRRTGRRRRSSSTTATSRRTRGTRERQAFQPQIHYFVGGATKLYGAALYRLRAEDFGELRHHDGISPAWPISYEEMEPYYTQAEQLYQVHGARGRIRPSRRRARPIPSRRCPTNRASSSSPTTSRRPASTRSTRPAASCSTRRTCRTAPASAADIDGFPCLVHAQVDAEVLAVRPALDHPNVTLLTNAEAVAARDRPAGKAVTEVVVSARASRRPIGGHRRGLLRRGQLGQAAARCRRTTSTRTGSPTAPIRSGATTCSTTARPSWPCPRSRTRPSSRRRLALNDFYFGATTSTTRWAASRWSASRRPTMYRGEKPLETKLAPKWTLERRGRPRGRLLAVHGGPAPPDNRVTLDRDGNIRLSYTHDQPDAAKRLYHQLKSMLGTWACTRTICSRVTPT